MAEQEPALRRFEGRIEHGRRRLGLAQQESGAAAGAVASRQAAVNMACASSSPTSKITCADETRFAVIGHQACDRTGNDKTAIAIRVPHNSGVAGAGVGRVQRKQAEPDMDRVVPGEDGEAGVHVLH
ncbi:MAG: hypothetical protein U0793_15790 [Gemmataceae bacterium]